MATVSRRRISGFRVARWMLYAGLAALVVCLLTSLPSALSGDTDEYGRVPIPGNGLVRLPAGEVDVSYEVGQNVNRNFDEPRVRIVAVATGGGERVTADFGGLLDAIIDITGSRESGDGYTRETIGSFDVPHAGVYRIEATPRDPQRYPDPRLTFGHSGGDAVWDAAKLGLLLLGIAILLAGAIAFGTAVRRLLRRI